MALSKDRELTTSPSCPLLHFQPAHIVRTPPPRRLPGLHFENCCLRVKTSPPTPASQSHQDWLIPMVPGAVPPTEGSTRSQRRWSRPVALGAKPTVTCQAGSNPPSRRLAFTSLFPDPKTTILPAHVPGSVRVHFVKHFGLSGSFLSVLSAPPLRHTREELTCNKTEGFRASLGSHGRVIARTASRRPAPHQGVSTRKP